MDKEYVKKYIRELEKEQLIDLFMSYLREEPEVIKIPVSIFEVNLSSLELIVKYLKEELGYSNKKIALLLKRSPQNIWITYRNARTKYPKRLPVRESDHDFPFKIITDTDLSVLEAIVEHLSDTLLAEEIAKLLHRSKKTVTTVHHRAKKKKFK